MEKNKLDSMKRMNEQMKQIVEFEALETKKILKNEKDSLNEKQLYKKMRQYWNTDAPDQYKIVDDSFMGPHGLVPFRLFYPHQSEGVIKNNCIVFIHGGGFTVGDIDTHEGIIRRLANESGAVVAAIDYRLAPQFKFPVQLDECEEFVNYLYNCAEDFQLDKDNISLAGDSAGAHLSLATAIKIRDKGNMTPKIKTMLLYYGSFGLEDSMSRRLYGGHWDGLSLKELNYYQEQYADPKDQDNPYRNLLNSDLTFGLPPAYILACELDPLADDSRLLQVILKEHGLTAKLDIFEGVIHGFLHYSRALSQSLEAIKNSAEFYKKYSKSLGTF